MHRWACWPPQTEKLLVDDLVEQDTCRLPEELRADLSCHDPVVDRSLTHLAGLLRAHRARLGTGYRRVDVGRHALPVPAHLRNG